MNGEQHVTVAFTSTVADSTGPCPAGATDHLHAIGGSESVAYCLCGWWWVTPFSALSLQAVEVAYGMAKMKANDHVAVESEEVDDQ